MFDANITRVKHLGQLASEVLGSEQTVKDFIDEWWQKQTHAPLLLSLHARRRAVHAPAAGVCTRTPTPRFKRLVPTS